MALQKLKPAVPKAWLIAIAGLVWCAVGLMLCILAYTWLQPDTFGRRASLELAGIGLAFAVQHFLLARVARRNIERIEAYADRGCLFAFQAWRSYFLIIVMIGLGVLLRHSTLPRDWLAVAYLAMGGGLLLSSGRYGVHLVRASKREFP